MDNEQKSKIPLTPRQIFWIRFALFIAFAIIIPFATMAIKFNMFDIVTTTKTTTHLKMSGWSIVAVIMFFLAISYFIKYIVHNAPFCMLTQFLDGFTKIIIPMLAVTLIGYITLTVFTNGLSDFLVVMGIFIGCYIVAIVVNPIPQYLHEKNWNNAFTMFDKFEEKRQERGK